MENDKQTMITVVYEQRLRKLAEVNFKLKFLNVRLHRLSGNPHPIISRLTGSRDIQKLRAHVKFLT
jgi:hypothetical protein